MIDWSWIKLSSELAIFIKDKLYVWVLFFIALVWTLIIIAYWKPEKFLINTKKLIYRSLTLLWLYYLLSIIKYFVYDFSLQPLYWQFSDTFNVLGIITFRSFTIPITILWIIIMFLFISPIILYINKKFKYNYLIVLMLILIFWGLSFLKLPSNVFIDFLYSRWFANFPFGLWIMPYLLWAFVAMLWFEKRRHIFLCIFWILTLIMIYYNHVTWLSEYINAYMYPLRMYFVIVSFFAMFLFIELLYFLEKSSNILVQKFLWMLTVLWNKSFSVYIIHWIIIDTVYYFTRNLKWILFYVPLFIVLYLFYYSKYYQLLKWKFSKLP